MPSMFNPTTQKPYLTFNAYNVLPLAGILVATTIGALLKGNDEIDLDNSGWNSIGLSMIAGPMARIAMLVIMTGLYFANKLQGVSAAQPTGNWANQVRQQIEGRDITYGTALCTALIPTNNWLNNDLIKPNTGFDVSGHFNATVLTAAMVALAASMIGRRNEHRSGTPTSFAEHARQVAPSATIAALAFMACTAVMQVNTAQRHHTTAEAFAGILMGVLSVAAASVIAQLTDKAYRAIQAHYRSPASSVVITPIDDDLSTRAAGNPASTAPYRALPDDLEAGTADNTIAAAGTQPPTFTQG